MTVKPERRISGKIKGALITIGAAGMFYLFNLGVINWSSNRVYIDKDFISITRADGAFGNTQLTKYVSDSYGREEVHQYRMLGESITAEDGGMSGEHDGLVDKLSIKKTFSNTTIVLTREDDYKKHKKEFDGADKLLKETKERFKEYLK